MIEALWPAEKPVEGSQHMAVDGDIAADGIAAVDIDVADSIVVESSVEGIAVVDYGYIDAEDSIVDVADSIAVVDIVAFVADYKADGYCFYFEAVVGENKVVDINIVAVACDNYYYYYYYYYADIADADFGDVDHCSHCRNDCFDYFYSLNRAS